MKNKKAYFFSLDAFITLTIILAVVLFIKPPTSQVVQEIDLQKDLITVLSSIKIGEINNSYVQELIANNTITNLNQSVLEQIGEFYANSRDEAEFLGNEILGNLDLEINVGLYFNEMLISISGSLPLENSTEVWTSRQIISGIDNNINSSSRGFSSRAFLFSENKVNYFYFGGYVGDGNISVYLGEDVVSAKVEAVFSGNFNVSINEEAPTSYNPSLGIPFAFTLSNGFSQGENILQFTSNEENLYIAGGFIKITYNDTSSTENLTKFYFPGIEGFINLYDGFYVPGKLKEMEVFLNYSSLYNVFLSIGNTTIYQGNGSSVQTTLTNSTLAGMLDFSEMNDKTIPVRFGLNNVSYVLNLKKDADVYSVTDISGSMAASCSKGGFCCWFLQDCKTESGCNACGGIYEDKISSAKEANAAFINSVLSDASNRVGLVAYSSSVDSSNTHLLSKDNVSLINEVNSWIATGTTCICCGINEGVNRLLSESNSSAFRSLVVMSDGEANVLCDEQGTLDAKQDAIQAACDAAAQGIIVYAVAFGTDADQTTLEAIASCGEGSFYFGSVEDLVAIYEEIAEEILNAAYYEQTVIGEGFHTSVYPSSYISVEYEKETPYGLIVNVETEEFGSNAPIGSFNLPSDGIPYEAKVVSYSGSKWTSKVGVYNNATSLWDNIFDLSEYGTQYIELGDPYVVNIPLDKLITGENLVNVSLGVNEINLTNGSEYDKIIYSIVKNISSFSPIVSSADGCLWTIEFEDGTNTTMDFPEDYSGDENCSYTSESIIYNNNDAIDSAIYNLFTSLDLDSDGKIETKFEEEDLTINSIEVEGIPFVWETEAQVRVWR